jgi:hypothetical protein
LRVLRQLPAEGCRTTVDVFDLWRAMPFARYQRRPQGEMQGKVLLVTFGGVRPRAQHLDGARQQSNGLGVGTAAERVFTGLPEIVYGPLVILPALEMHG